MKAILKKVLPAWRAFERATHVGPIRDAMSALMGALIDETGTNKAHPLCGLLYLVGENTSANTILVTTRQRASPAWKCCAS